MANGTTARSMAKENGWARMATHSMVNGEKERSMAKGATNGPRVKTSPGECTMMANGAVIKDMARDLLSVTIP